MGEEDEDPWAAEEISRDWSPWVITNLDIQLFKSEVRRSRLLMEDTMQFLGIDEAVCNIVLVVGIDCNIQIWIHNIEDKYEFIW